MSHYRDRIYANYASNIQDAAPFFDHDAARRWGKAYDSYLRGWLPGERSAAIVDVACGWGRLLSFFKDRGYERLAGVDISPEQVAIARQITPHVTEGNAIEFLKNSPGTFDLVTGLDIVEHFTKNEVFDFLDACYTSLKPGGRLILQTPNAGCPWGAEHRYNDLTHELGFNPNALTRLLQVCRFARIATREMGPVPWGYSWRSSLRYLAWQGLRAGIQVYNTVETGGTGSGIFTRVFLACAWR